MAGIDSFRALIQEWDQHLHDNAVLRARIAELEAALTPELWWNDPLQSLPTEGPGKYLISGRLPGGALEMTDFLGSRCLRMRIRSNQRDENQRCRTEIGFWDPASTGRKFELIPFRETRWFHHEWAVDDTWFEDSNKIHMGQWHSTPDTADGPGRSGPLDFAIVRDEIRFRRLWDDQATSPGGPQNLLTTKVATLEPNRWYKWTVQVRFDWRKVAAGGVGFTKVWLDDVLVFNEVGPNAYNDKLGNYYRFGGYWPEAIAPGYPQDKVRDYYVRNIRLGGPEHELKHLLQA